MCYWCYWGWPKPIRDIYDDCAKKHSESLLLYGPAHVVWGDENWDAAQSCLEHLDENKGDFSHFTLVVVRESLERLLKVPDEFKTAPNGFDYTKHDPKDFPPPKHWECEKR